MRKKSLLFILVIATTATAFAQPQQQDVLRAMRLANTYFMTKWPDPGTQIVTNIARPSNIWTRAVYYEGLMALYSIDPKKAYLDYAIDWGNKHNWTPRNGVTNRNADDQCAGQTWIDLYKLDPQPNRITAIKASIDNMVHSDKADDWHWVDAIQMAMPVFTRLGVEYHDTSYFRKMYDLYHYTKTVHGTHGLYNPEEHLWWRDKDFVPPYKEPNGQNCYWSRGNGWVLAALVRVLSMLPLDNPHRAEYLQDYKDMVSAIVPLQRTDGYWNCSLHDSTHFGGKELSGTALFTYGISWGIRNGFLDKKQYYPIVAKAWTALAAESLHPNGMLGWVQGTGKEPKDGQPVTYDKIPDFEDYGLGCFLLAGSEVYQICTPPAANLDESKVPPYEEPKLDLTTIKNWEAVQRPAMLHSFAKNVYGRLPANSIPLRVQATATQSTDIGIKKELTLYFSATDTAARLHLVLWLPKNKKGKVPVFVGYSFTPNAQTETSAQWPLKTILDHGYGVAYAWYWDIEPDRPDGWQTGIRTRLADKLAIQPWEWSAMGAWAWGLSRIADYLVTNPAVDRNQLIVIGHSRLGKAAVWAGANDQRFALVVSNESGEGGAALGKRDYGETIAIINDKFPWWFGANYKQFGNDPAAMPTDQFELLALIAPRPLYVASAVGDQWSDPKGEFLSARLAGPVWHLYKKKGLETDSMPSLEHPAGETIRYHIRNGKHDLTLYDWQEYMNFADKQFGRK
ncbi:glycoside hydrolase family 88 protein [Puia sp.]|jgi:rhamnogalacturonyl hydrolase YesR|uniref:glycoside hydrolase family 88 protein n=1 Tax=Puia sp. TaxID=2045100 RepID=UPI002F3EF1BF